MISSKYGLYFLIGGVVVSVSTYWGTKGHGFLAAFASTFPAMTGVTILLIYLNGGNASAMVYAKHLLWFVPPWLVYVGFIIYGLERIGILDDDGGRADAVHVQHRTGEAGAAMKHPVRHDTESDNQIFLVMLTLITAI